MKSLCQLTVSVLVLMLACPAISFANIQKLKAYREVNPELKSDCTYCHINKLPKKEEGQHELNPYGLKVKEAIAGRDKDKSEEESKEIYISVFKQLGRHDASGEAK